jgi:hypothetical protein
MTTTMMMTVTPGGAGARGEDLISSPMANKGKAPAGSPEVEDEQGPAGSPSRRPSRDPLVEWTDEEATLPAAPGGRATGPRASPEPEPAEGQRAALPVREVVEARTKANLDRASAPKAKKSAGRGKRPASGGIAGAAPPAQKFRPKVPDVEV